MIALVELLMSDGGLQGASPRQVRAVLDKLATIAVVVPNGSLPEARFGVADATPFVALLNVDGAMNTTKPFEHQYLSPSRAMRAVKEAMAVHAAITSDDPYRRAAYDRSREMYLRNRLEAKSVADGGSHALAEGAL